MKKIARTATGVFLVTSIVLIACSPSHRVSNISANEAKSFISGWPAKPQEVANVMIDKYGPPAEVTDNILVWNKNGPWKKTVLFKEEVPHDFPKPHTDLLQQFIDYQTPIDKFDDLAQYDGSVIAERTKGEISARCDKEEMNFLALNLAHDVATGKKTVEEARQYYTKAAMAFMNGEKDPYTQGLKFTVSKGGTGDRDTPAKM
jgi:hypothetical protein